MVIVSPCDENAFSGPSIYSTELKVAGLSDMRPFVHAVMAGSLSAAGRELGFSPAAASKRLSRLEAQLGARLVQRTVLPRWTMDRSPIQIVYASRRHLPA